MACNINVVVPRSPSPKTIVNPHAATIPRISTPLLNTAANGLALKSIRRTSHVGIIRAMSVSDSKVMEKMGVQIERNPSEARLSELKVRSWPKWGCPPSKFPWTYTAMERCYLLEGKVKVYPDGYNDHVEIGSGDLVMFPKGMKCTWDVSEAVDKHYTFYD